MSISFTIIIIIIIEAQLSDDKVKVCFLTAGEMDYEQFGKELFPALDKNCYIQKPIENETLIKRINRIMTPSN